MISRCHPRARTARRGLLWGLALFAVTQFVLGLAVHCWLPELRDPFYDGKTARLRRLLRDTERPLTVVALGSSRTAYAVRGGDLAEPLRHTCGRPVIVFNLGVAAAGPITELLHLRRLLDDGFRPDLVLLEVLPTLLADRGRVPAEAHWLPVHRLRLADLDLLRHYGFSEKHFRRAWWRGLPVPCYHHRFSLLDYGKERLVAGGLVGGVSVEDAYGWRRQQMRTTTSADFAAATERARLDYVDFFRDFRLGGATPRALRATLELCREHQLPAALLLMPEGPTFRSWYPPGAWEQVQDHLDGLCAEFGVELVNARAWHPEADFCDSHHLLTPGAERFTIRLGREAILPLLRRHAGPFREGT